MTERERLLEKIRKVQALANRGADGEKQSAAALLDRLMTQYGIDEAEIAEERLEKCFFRYKTPYERKLLVQVIYTVTGKIPFKCVGSYSGRARKQVGIDCTAAERLEIEFSYEFYKAALEEEMERFYSAFLMKNDIFPPASKKAEEIPAAEISRSEALKLQALVLDVSQLGVFLAYVGTPTATVIGFYSWKAKAENVVKIKKANPEETEGMPVDLNNVQP